MHKLIFLALFIIGNPLMAQKSSDYKLGLSVSYGLHSNLISSETEGYAANGVTSAMLWFIAKPKSMHIALEPRLGVSAHNYIFILSEKSERLSYKMVYADFSINANLNLNKSKVSELITGIFFGHHLFSDPTIVENGVGGKNQIQFSGELEEISDRSSPNKLLAGINLGYRIKIPKLRRLSFEVDVQQQIVNLFRKTVEFNYMVNRTKNEFILFNGKPTTIFAQVRYQFISG